MTRNSALVTGVGRTVGLGAGIARRLAVDGWDLALSYWHPYDQRVNGTTNPASELQELIPELEALGSRVIALPGDLEDSKTPGELIAAARMELGTLSGLVLSHTEGVDSGLLTTSVKSFDRHFAVNVRASWQLINAFALQCNDNGGAIVALTSDHTVNNLPYGASKGALDRIVLAAARELGDRGISSNALNPGPVDTGWMTNEVRQALTQRQPTGRLGTPADVAGVVAFLLSQDGRWVNGQLIKADGGFSA
ncbi:SDR family oxidoreductase [Arthrobacter sp. H20]|uniref:SDR family oxidoreductase n=1 Tax=Arthrobacter sp. H20 TaxID=1267981 RepID=UPI00047BF923|nr:SDR family oxidoreductase [Arthrobacter sp. H20]